MIRVVRLNILIAMLIFACNTVAAQKPFYKLSEGDIFPEIMFTTIDGELLKTENLSGKVVFYNFYFAACAPCIAQKKVLNELYEKFHVNDDVVFISLTFDNYETTKRFRDIHGIKFKIIITNREEKNRFAVSAWPTNILVGIDGKIALKMVGGRNNQTRNKFSSAILSELQKIKSEK
jgi:peroxiredoxin